MISTTTVRIYSQMEDQESTRLVFSIDLIWLRVEIMISADDKSGFEVCSSAQMAAVNSLTVWVIVHRAGGEAFSKH